MNFSMVKRLILKDWYLQRWLILGSLPAGAITLGIIAIGGNAGFFLGILLLVTVIIAVGGQLAVATMVSERKEQTLAFVISLPISYREYTAAKILGNLLIFLVPWITLVLGSFALLMFPPALHLGLIPFVAIMAASLANRRAGQSALSSWETWLSTDSDTSSATSPVSPTGCGVPHSTGVRRHPSCCWESSPQLRCFWV